MLPTPRQRPTARDTLRAGLEPGCGMDRLLKDLLPLRIGAGRIVQIRAERYQHHC